MIRVRVLHDGHEMEEAELADLPALRADKHALIWVEVVSPSHNELAYLGQEFGIHEVALEDLQVGERQRPKVEHYPDQDQLLLVYYGAQVGLGDHPTRLWEVDLIAGGNYLITSHGGGPVDPKPFARRVKARRELAAEGAGYLLYVALDDWSTPSSRPWTPSATGCSRWRRRSWPGTPTSRAGSSTSARS